MSARSMMAMNAPTITRQTGPEPVITCEARIMLWEPLRRVAGESGCTVDESRIGWITKSFTIRGDIPALQRFINIAWNEPSLAKSFREELSKHGRA